jgi:hypothetical protein
MSAEIKEESEELAEERDELAERSCGTVRGLGVAPDLQF